MIKIGGEQGVCPRNRHSSRTEVIIVKAAAKLFMIFFCLSIMVFFSQSQASPPAKIDATPEKWQYYASDEDETDYSYNAADIKRMQGNIVRVWVQAKYSEKNLKYSEGRFQWEIDCSAKTMRGIQAYAKKKDGTSAIVTESSDWSIIPSESTAETLYEKVCKKPAKKNDKVTKKKAQEKKTETKAP
jgi:hypothetical protein